MEQSDLLKHLVAALDRLQIAYFITGSLASISFGEPRLTIDIDVAVSLRQDQVNSFCRQFPEPDFYISLEAAKEAIRNQSMFNIIHGESGHKIDVILAKRDALTTSQLQRATSIQRADGYEMRVASPEDIIINKLMFYKVG